MTSPIGDPVVTALAVALTADQLTNGIARALERRDIKAVPYYLAAMAIVDPKQAELVRQTITVGLAMRAEQAD